jgi:hypothetical protein
MVHADTPWVSTAQRSSLKLRMELVPSRQNPRIFLTREFVWRLGVRAIVTWAPDVGRSSVACERPNVSGSRSCWRRRRGNKRTEAVAHFKKPECQPVPIGKKLSDGPPDAGLGLREASCGSVFQSSVGDGPKGLRRQM